MDEVVRYLHSQRVALLQKFLVGGTIGKDVQRILIAGL